MNKLVEIRNKLKLKKPTFRRHDSHKKKRVSAGWRRPRGRQSKQRLGMKGYARGRSTGYSSPNEVRGLSHEGLTQTIVNKLSDFTGLDPKTDGIIVARTVGNRRRLELVEYASKNKFALLNIDETAFKKSVEEKLSQKSAKKKEFEKKQKEKAAAAKADEKKEAKAAKKEEAKEPTEEKSDEQKAQEKKDYDKLLTKN